MVIDFSTFYDLPRELNRFFDDGPSPFLLSRRGAAYPLVNTAEDEENLYVDVNAPGVEQEDIDLTVSAKNLVIKGERKPPEGRFYRQERLGGSFQRILSIATPVEVDKVKARFQDGILSVVLPKAESVKPRKISIDA